MGRGRFKSLLAFDKGFLKQFCQTVCTCNPSKTCHKTPGFLWQKENTHPPPPKKIGLLKRHRPEGSFSSEQIWWLQSCLLSDFLIQLAPLIPVILNNRSQILRKMSFVLTKCTFLQSLNSGTGKSGLIGFSLLFQQLLIKCRLKTKCYFYKRVSYNWYAWMS